MKRVEITMKPLKKTVDMVNHPSHYEKGDGHIECIDLLRVLTEGYSGIAAMEIGQFKYLYRAGSKSEKGLSQNQKFIEDVKKLIFYMSDFKKHGTLECNNKELAYGYVCVKDYRELEGEFIAQEFTFDKPENIKDFIKDAVKTAYCIRHVEDVDRILSDLSSIVKILSKAKE